MSKKIAIINDLSGYGRCSISVILPIISHLGIQGCPLPTALFSNHTGFPSFFHRDLTNLMPAYIAEWQKLNLSFDGIMTGFLGSAQQAAVVENFIRTFRQPTTTVLIDPVMGDNGHIYATYTREMCEEMKRLIAYADILTPNLTEACFLTDTPYHPSGWKKQDLAILAKQLMHMGARQLVITGIIMGDSYIGNVLCTSDGEIELQRQMKVEQTRSGTGDVFASILAADAVHGIPFSQSTKRASHFVRQCLLNTIGNGETNNTGINFEECLWQLRAKA